MKIKIKKLNSINRGVIVITAAVLLGSFLVYSGNSLAVTISVSDSDINDLQDEIKLKQRQIEELNKQKEEYERSLSQTRKQISSLNGQINNLDNVIAKLTIEIQTIGLEKEEVALQMQNIKYTAERVSDDINDQQLKIATILKTLNRNTYQSEFVSILLSNKSIGDFFANINQLNKINNELSQKLIQFVDKKTELKRQENLLAQKNEQLDELNNKLEASKEKLAGDKSFKDGLLKQTKGEEGKYASLIKELKAEQNSINSEIYNLELEARKKLYALKGEEFLASETGYIWPVPSRKVTAKFHDPDYPFRQIFEHPAIDIGSTPQGTAIRAVKSGYVAKVKDTGRSGGYNYIMLVHSDGISSVYGHLSNMIVEEDTFVVQGEIIGYSGGMPGTAGAGNLTTGPHLHLEIRKNGIPVNPLNYLP